MGGKGGRKAGDDGISPEVAEMIRSLEELTALIESGEPIAKKFTVRRMTLDLTPRAYGPAEVKRLRARFGASQALFARFLNVTPGTVSAWEQGTRNVPGIARRFLDVIDAHPEVWASQLRPAVNED